MENILDIWKKQDEENQRQWREHERYESEIKERQAQQRIQRLDGKNPIIFMMDQIINRILFQPDISYFQFDIIENFCFPDSYDEMKNAWHVLDRMKEKCAIQNWNRLNNTYVEITNPDSKKLIEFRKEYTDKLTNNTSNLPIKFLSVNEKYFQLEVSQKKSDYQFPFKDKSSYLIYFLVENIESGLPPKISHAELQGKLLKLYDTKKLLGKIPKYLQAGGTMRSETATLIMAANNKFECAFPAYGKKNVFKQNKGVEMKILDSVS